MDPVASRKIIYFNYDSIDTLGITMNITLQGGDGTFLADDELSFALRLFSLGSSRKVLLSSFKSAHVLFSSIISFSSFK